MKTKKTGTSLNDYIERARKKDPEFRRGWDGMRAIEKYVEKLLGRKLTPDEGDKLSDKMCDILPVTPLIKRKKKT